MLLSEEINRTPNSYNNPRLSVRSAIASLYLSRKINLHIIARRNDVTPLNRWMVLYNARQIENLARRYHELARHFGLEYLIINTRLLNAAACSIATHCIRGEYEAARRMRSEVLNSEAELSEIAVYKALKSGQHQSASTNTNNRAALAA